MSSFESLKLGFRLLILASVGLYVFWFYGPSIFYVEHAPEVQDALSWNGYGAKFSWDVMIGSSHLFLFSYGVICIGLIYFKNWARVAFVFFTIITSIFSLGYGLHIFTPFSALHLQIMYIIDGFVLGVIFFSNLSELYDETHNKRMQSDQPVAGR